MPTMYTTNRVTLVVSKNSVEDQYRPKYNLNACNIALIRRTEKNTIASHIYRMASRISVKMENFVFIGQPRV